MKNIPTEHPTDWGGKPPPVKRTSAELHQEISEVRNRDKVGVKRNNKELGGKPPSIHKEKLKEREIKKLRIIEEEKGNKISSIKNFFEEMSKEKRKEEVKNGIGKVHLIVKDLEVKERENKINAGKDNKSEKELGKVGIRKKELELAELLSAQDAALNKTRESRSKTKGFLRTKHIEKVWQIKSGSKEMNEKLGSATQRARKILNNPEKDLLEGGKKNESKTKCQFLVPTLSHNDSFEKNEKIEKTDKFVLDLVLGDNLVIHHQHHLSANGSGRVVVHQKMELKNKA